ncbi:MAG: twin-arginine translocation pathway signal, partial [Pseudomonadota bacterium]
MASAPWDNRLVVIILRGGLDGLDAVRPYNAPEFNDLRGGLLTGQKEPGAFDLDGFFALHPAFSDLMPLWRAGELSFAHAVSTPYRDKRSHFDGQDILEAGTGDSAFVPSRDGWLNRLLSAVPGTSAETAFAIGRQAMLITKGPAAVSDWSPDASLLLSPQAERLLDLVMHDDPLFRDALTEAIDLSQEDVAAQFGDEEIDAADMMNATRRTANLGSGKQTNQKIAE